MKNTKKALLTSALCLLLCCSMLIGTTFAWFTDEVKSGNNIIQSGNLDVELEYAKVVEGEPTTWATVAGKTEIFNPDALWEPGHMEIVYLRVSNLGTLELKYQLGVNVADEHPGITVDENGQDKAFKLSDYLVFKVVEIEKDKVGTFTRENAIEADDELGLKDYNGETKALDPKGGENDMDYVALIVYMPTTVGNEANHKTGTDAPMIKLGINLFATQKDAESDSFGPDYDEDAWHPEMKVYSAQDLQAAINNGETNIKLMDDIELTGPIVIPAPVTGRSAAVEPTPIVINLNGKTLSNPNGYVIENYGNVVITGNGTVAGMGGIRSHSGTVVIEGGNFYASSRWQDGVYQHTLKAENTVVTINGGNFDATQNGHTNAMLNASENSVITINGGNFKNVAGELTQFDPYIFTYEKNGKAVINGGTFYGGWRFNGENTTTDVYGGNFTVSFDGQSFHANSTHVLTVYGGTFTNGARLTQKLNAIVADGYKVVDNVDGTYTVLKGEVVVTNDAELVAAIAEGKTEIAMAPGNYQFPLSANLQGKNLTLVGTKGVVIYTRKVNQNHQFVTGANLKFEGVTLNFGTAIYMGFANTASLTYKDCAVNGLQFVCGTGTVSFENCDLNSNGAEHSLWTWGISNISFTGCDFTYGDRAVNCYAEHGQTTNASFTDCTFTKVAGKETTGAIETNSAAMTRLNLTINNCSVNEGDLWWVSSWDSKGGANTYTTVDGKVTVATAKQLAAVVANGATDIYLMDGEYNIEGCGGKTLTLTGSKNAVLKVMNEGEDGCDYGFGGPTGVGNITFNGLTIDTTANTGNYKGYAYMKGTFNDCNFVGAYSLNNANDFVFNRCTFDFKNGYFWTWGANSVTFNECVFNGNSKAILAHGSASTVININNCAFAATEKGYTGSGDNTAVVEMDPVGFNTYTINFTGENTITDSYADWTRVKDGSTGHIITGLN